MRAATHLLFGELLPVPSKAGADRPELPGVRCHVYADRFSGAGVGVLFSAVPDESVAAFRKSLSRDLPRGEGPGKVPKDRALYLRTLSPRASRRPFRPASVRGNLSCRLTR